MMRLILLPAILVLASGVHAQETAPSAPAAPAPAAPPVADPAKEAVSRQIAVRQQRVTALVNQIVELDSGIEAAIASVQSMLKSVTDSKDSDTKVARIKKDVMVRLQKAAEYYAQKRSAAGAGLQGASNRYERADLFKDRSVLDERINKRIDGIIELALSMDSHEDYEKYLYTGGGDGWNIPNIRRNPDYDHNRKVARQGGAAKTEIEKALEKSVARLDSEERTLKQKVAKAGDGQKAALEEELQRVRQLKMQRYDQEEDLRQAKNPGARPVDMKEARRIESVIEAIAADARRDFNALFARYSELKTERTALARLQARLEAMETAAGTQP